jgi:glyoxylase-like metal-dependent hydrolase (beta-lactamase superfamily II)
MIRDTRHGQVLCIQMSRYPDFRPPRAVSAYVINDLIIDTGPACTAGELADFLGGTDIRMAVNTHHHEDHVGANKFLQDGPGTEIFAHPVAVEKIRERPVLSAPQEEVWGYPVPSEVKPVPDYVETSGLRFEVIYTPGHDRGHICLFEGENGWLFSGDAYITSRPVVCRNVENQWQMIEDLKRIRDLQPAAMFTGPSGVIIGPAPKLTRTIGYLEDLGAEVIRLYNSGMEISQIRQTVFGDESPFAALTLGQFSSLNMVRSFLRKCGNNDED